METPADKPKKKDEESSCVEQVIPEEENGHGTEDLGNICPEGLSGAAATSMDI